MNDIDLERAIEFQKERKARLVGSGIPKNAGTMSTARFDNSILSEGSNPLIKQRFAHVFQGKSAKAILDAAQNRDRINSFEKIPEKKIKGPSVKEEYKVEPAKFNVPNDATSRELRSIEDMFDPDKNGSRFVEPQGQRSVVGLPQYGGNNANQLSDSDIRMPEFDPRRQILSRAASRAQAQQELDYRSMASQANQHAEQYHGGERQMYAQQQQAPIDFSMIQEMVEIMAEKKVKEILGNQTSHHNKNLTEVKFYQVNNLKDKNGNRVENVVKIEDKYYKMSLKEIKVLKK